MTGMNICPVRRSPPAPCPIDAALEQLKSAAKKGDVRAMLRIRAIATFCREALAELPPKVTKKTKRASTPTNALASHLLSIVELTKNHGKGSSALDIEIRDLPPLTPTSFPDWWRCAWAFTKDQHWCDEKMKALIDKIGADTPLVRRNFEARKSTLLQIIKKGERPALGLTFQNDVKLTKEFLKVGATMTNEWRAYVKKQTEKAAKRIWFEP